MSCVTENETGGAIAARERRERRADVANPFMWGGRVRDRSKDGDEGARDSERFKTKVVVEIVKESGEFDVDGVGFSHAANDVDIEEQREIQLRNKRVPVGVRLGELVGVNHLRVH